MVFTGNCRILLVFIISDTYHLLSVTLTRAGFVNCTLIYPLIVRVLSLLYVVIPFPDARVERDDHEGIDVAHVSEARHRRQTSEAGGKIMTESK